MGIGAKSKSKQNNKAKTSKNAPKKKEKMVFAKNPSQAILAIVVIEVIHPATGGVC